jgi:SAM-dependent methyltransferase
VTTWAAGDYPAMARQLLPAALAAVSAAQVAPGDRVLDVGTGTGNAALLAALRGGRVTGVDVEPELLSRARRHADESGLDVEWLLGDAARLPVPDAYADVVLSVFGVMYAEDQAAAAAELARVCAPRGRIVLSGWIPGGVMPALGRVLAPYLPPPPPGAQAPSRWGDAAAVTELLETAGLTVTSAQPRHLTVDVADAAEATDLLIDTAGHVVAERPRLEAEGRWTMLVEDVRSFAAARSTSGHLRLDHLLVTATCRA